MTIKQLHVVVKVSTSQLKLVHRWSRVAPTLPGGQFVRKQKEDINKVSSHSSANDFPLGTEVHFFCKHH